MKATFLPPVENVFGTQFRNYTENKTERQRAVEQFYKINHENQTYDFVQSQKKHWLTFDKKVMSVWEAAEFLNEIIDDSDPDLDLPQIVHLLQTAEACRAMHPDEEWLHLTGFLHDLGKVMSHSEFGSLPQWACVGDTFPVGCAHEQSVIYHKFFDNNPDKHDPKYNTALGVYTKNCGLETVDMSWGHDEYMYQVMLKNNCTLPPAAHFIVRYHSFYALHRDDAYGYLLNEEDARHLAWLKEFNKHDLYTKSHVPADVAALKDYYQGLIKKYFPEKLVW